MATPLPSMETVTKTARTYARDLTERVVSTYLQAFVAGAVLTEPLDLEMWQAATAAGGAAVLALVKGLVARLTSVRNSASVATGV
ncbi:hypothetical protein H8N00_10610 [Streptomyces sp. AC563]|uniref:hypothetical protein n=1 Tax=Streptomyces buecherae TaxID=2763006 RepID=UPI00164DD77A|nr:hypothetical protein [Streptomyces buecherae]MBC3989323.1 hypothetical protein [Streptomyces buecherae]